ncbi:MAG: hypothetical protein ACREKH_10365, partial [Candidatus Rokuibacteriota bacterium]
KGRNEMRKLMTGIAFAAALALCGGSAFAVDQQITGKKLLILNPGGSPSTNNKIVYLSKDTDIAIPGAPAEDPRCVVDGGSGAGGVLTVNSTASGESATVTLPCAGWSVNGAGTLHKYKDPSGATCKIVLIKGGKLQKAVCKGTAVQPYDLSADQVSVDVLVRTGTTPRRWCTTFNGTTSACTVVKDGSDNKKYLAKNCTAAPAVCPASPSGAFLDDAGLF